MNPSPPDEVYYIGIDYNKTIDKNAPEEALALLLIEKNLEHFKPFRALNLYLPIQNKLRDVRKEEEQYDLLKEYDKLVIQQENPEILGEAFKEYLWKCNAINMDLDNNYYKEVDWFRKLTPKVGKLGKLKSKIREIFEEDEVGVNLYPGAKKFMKKLKNSAGDETYVEVCSHNLKELIKVGLEGDCLKKEGGYYDNIFANELSDDVFAKDLSNIENFKINYKVDKGKNRLLDHISRNIGLDIEEKGENIVYLDNSIHEIRNKDGKNLAQLLNEVGGTYILVPSAEDEEKKKADKNNVLVTGSWKDIEKFLGLVDPKSFQGINFS